MTKFKIITAKISDYLCNAKIEFLIVLGLAILNAGYLFVFKYTPSLDGAQHLYNTNVIGQILKGNDFVKSYFEINNVIVGYWTAHAILSFFNLLLPAWLADKLFLLIYLIATPLLFRYMIRAFNPRALYTSILIFPALYNGYYFMGYYAFIIAWPVVFLLFGYFFRHIDNMRLKHWLVLSLLFLLAFLSHMIVFAFALAIVFGWLIFDLLYARFKTREIKFRFKMLRIGKTILSLLPALALSIIYVRHVFRINAGTNLGKFVSKSFSELWETFTNLSVLVAFSHEKESTWNVFFFWVLFSLMIIALVYNFSYKKNDTLKTPSRQNYTLFWGLVSFLILIIYFVFPNTFGTGSVSNRILVFFLFSFIAFLALQRLPFWGRIIIVASVMIYCFNMYNIRKMPFKEQNSVILNFMQCERFLEPNSTYVSFRCHDVWSNLHYGCYVGIEKPLVYLNSPQNLGHFPVIWNFDNAPKPYLGLYSPYDLDKTWFIGSSSEEICPIDYVFVYGHANFLRNEAYQNLKNSLLLFYEIVGTSDNNYSAVYKFKLNDYIENKKLQMIDDSTWNMQIIEKSRIRGISMNDMLYLDALYIYMQNADLKNAEK